MTYPAFVQAIADVVRPELEVHAPLQLQEPNPGGQHPPIKIGCHDDVLALSFDQCCCQLWGSGAHLGEWLHPLFRDGKRLRESCDYVLFHEEHETLWVLLVELKSHNSGSARDQIMNTRLLIDHLLSVVEKRSGYSGDLPRKRQYRGVVFNEKCAALKIGPKSAISYVKDPRMPDIGLATLRRVPFVHLAALCA